MTKGFLFLLAALAVAVVGLVGCSKSHNEFVISDRALSVGTDFAGIALPTPLQYSLKVQEIEIELADKYEVVTSPTLMIRLEHGPAFMPEMQLADSENRQYRVRATAFWGNRIVFNAPYTNGDPIVKMQIRSEEPIHVQRVIWFSYDPESFKR